jgi:hypothetical protein
VFWVLRKLRGFQFSAFSFLLFPPPPSRFFCFFDHGREDRDQLGRLRFQWGGQVWIDTAFFTKQFKPKRGFIGFLKGATQLGGEFIAGTCARGFTFSL